MRTTTTVAKKGGVARTILVLEAARQKLSREREGSALTKGVRHTATRSGCAKR